MLMGPALCSSPPDLPGRPGAWTITPDGPEKRRDPRDTGKSRIGCLVPLCAVIHQIHLADTVSLSIHQALQSIVSSLAILIKTLPILSKNFIQCEVSW